MRSLPTHPNNNYDLTNSNSDNNCLRSPKTNEIMQTSICKKNKVQELQCPELPLPLFSTKIYIFFIENIIYYFLDYSI